MKEIIYVALIWIMLGVLIGFAGQAIW